MRIYRQTRRVLSRSDFRRGVTLLVGGTALGQGILIVTAPLLTRLYSPSDLGAYAVATAIIALLVTITCLRYEYAIPLPDSDVTAANTLALSLLAALGTSASAAVVLYVAGPTLLALVGAPVLGPYALLLPLGQLGGGVVSALSLWALRTGTFSEIAANRLTQSGTLVAVQLGLGATGAGALGLLVGAVVGSIAGSTRLATVAWRGHALSFRRVSRAGILSASRRYRRFPIFSAPSALLNMLGLQAPLLVLVAVYGPATGGQYALADRICGLPVSLVATAVGQVYFAETARLARDQAGTMAGAFGRTTRSLARLAVGPFAMLAVAAPVLAAPIFGSQWGEAGLFVTILAPMYFLQLVTSPTSSALAVLERQDLGLTREVLRLCLVSVAVAIVVAAKLTPVGAVVAISAAGCLAYLIYGYTTWRAIAAHDAGLRRALATASGQADDSPGWVDR